MLEASTGRVLWNPSRSAVPELPAHPTVLPLPRPPVLLLPAPGHTPHMSPSLTVATPHSHPPPFIVIFNITVNGTNREKIPQTPVTAAEVGGLWDPLPRAVVWAGMVGLEEPGDLFQPCSVLWSVGACREGPNRTLAKGCPLELIHKHPSETPPER